MHYVYLTDSVVTDQAQVDPYTIFQPEYASQFIEAPDEVTFGWKKENGQWVAPPAPPAPDYKQLNKAQAESLLQASDWTEYKSVRDVTKTPHLLNGDAFDNYRVALRGIAVNPPETEVTDWPVKPDEEWSN